MHAKDGTFFSYNNPLSSHIPLLPHPTAIPSLTPGIFDMHAFPKWNMNFTLFPKSIHLFIIFLSSHPHHPTHRLFLLFPHFSSRKLSSWTTSLFCFVFSRCCMLLPFLLAALSPHVTPTNYLHFSRDTAKEQVSSETVNNIIIISSSS